MRVLVVHASAYGATEGIAERIGATLRQHGLVVTVRPVQDAGDPADYDACVIGSAAYYFHWMKKATNFLRRNRAVLAERPVWLFSSGPLGTESKDAQGRDLLTVTEPKEIAEFREAIHPRDHRVFFGALDRNKLGFTHRLLLKLPVNRDNAIFPLGDFRDWNDIAAWASNIALALKASADGAASSHADLHAVLTTQ
ncbi:MAG: flavodoxin domain-containing protein [Candidatus Sulfotelmatobacter sp.]